MAKDKEYNKLIHTGRWLRLRRDVCEQEGKITPATEVHHVRPVEEAVGKAERRQRMYDPANLRALCHDCHVRTHTELGRCGKAATKKRNTEQIRQVIEKFFN